MRLQAGDPETAKVQTAEVVSAQPLTSAIGAELHGVDASHPTDEVVAAIDQALLRYKVVFFRDQVLDDRAQRDFAARFGPLQRFPFGAPVDEAIPEIHAIASGGAAAKTGNADIWHSDATFMATPPLGSVLRAVHLPPYGGDTLFANGFDG